MFPFFPLYSLSLSLFLFFLIFIVLEDRKRTHTLSRKTPRRRGNEEQTPLPLQTSFSSAFSPPALAYNPFNKERKKNRKEKKLRLSLIPSRVSFLPYTHYYIVTSFDAASTVSNIIDPPTKSPFLPLWRYLNDRERGAKLKAERKREEDKIPLFQESFILCPSSNNRRKISAKERRDNPPGDLTHSQSPFSNAG